MEKKKKCGKCNCPKGRKHKWTCPDCGYGHKYKDGNCMWCDFCSKGHSWKRDYINQAKPISIYCERCGVIAQVTKKQWSEIQKGKLKLISRNADKEVKPNSSHS